MTILASQSNNIQNVRDISYVNENPPRGTSGVTLWGDKYQLVNTNNPFMKFFTGVNPQSPKTNYQLATIPIWPCTSGIQASGNEIGINIQSGSIKKNFAGRGNLGTIVLGTNFQPKTIAFPSENTKFKYSFDLKVPSMRAYGNVAAQVVAYINFVDFKNKLGFWYGISIFDNRGTDYKDTVSWDVGTSTAIVTAFDGRPTPLLESAPSAGFFSKPFSNFKHYEFVIGESQMKTAIKLLRGYNPAATFSENLSDYYVSNCNLNPEIHVPSGLFNYAQIGLAVQNWKLEQI